MALRSPSPRRPSVGTPALNIAIFAVFVVITLAIVIRVSRRQEDRRAVLRRRPAPSPAARTASPSPATTCRPRRFLGIAGAIAINGYDGFLYSIGFLVAWLVALLLVAELLRNTGRFTMADVLSLPAAASGRSASRPPSRRSPCASSTCWPRWPAPAAWSRCCSASRASSASASSSSSSACS